MNHYMFHMDQLSEWFQEAEQIWEYSDIYFDSHIGELDSIIYEACEEYGRYWHAQENISIHIDS